MVKETDILAPKSFVADAVLSLTYEDFFRVDQKERGEFAVQSPLRGSRLEVTDGYLGGADGWTIRKYRLFTGKVESEASILLDAENKRFVMRDANDVERIRMGNTTGILYALDFYDTDGTLAGTILGDKSGANTRLLFDNADFAVFDDGGGTGSIILAGDLRPIGSGDDYDIGLYGSSYQKEYIKHKIVFPQTQDDNSTEIYETKASELQGGMREEFTSTVAQNVFTIALGDGASTGGQLFFTLDWKQTSGTANYMVESGVLTWSAVNKGGVYTTDTQEDVLTSVSSDGAATLTHTWAFTTGANQITLQITATWSFPGTAGTTSKELRYMLMSHNNQTITVDLN